MKIAPSVLAADFTKLGEQIVEVNQTSADRLHVDVMDGVFVPNISMGPLALEALKQVTDLPLETHLMIVEPERHFEMFVKAGATSLIIHQETCPHLHRSIQQIKDLGVGAGVALNPATPISTLENILPDLDLVLIMTVNPGFGGQSFIESMLDKIRALRAIIDEQNLNCEIEVDGGVNANTISNVAKAGVDVAVAGTAVFGHPGGIAGGVTALEVS
jgi:ribulose-phosphate 3-epimerase